MKVRKGKKPLKIRFKDSLLVEVRSPNEAMVLDSETGTVYQFVGNDAQVIGIIHSYGEKGISEKELARLIGRDVIGEPHIRHNGVLSAVTALIQGGGAQFKGSPRATGAAAALLAAVAVSTGGVATAAPLNCVTPKCSSLGGVCLWSFYPGSKAWCTGSGGFACTDENGATIPNPGPGGGGSAYTGPYCS